MQQSPSPSALSTLQYVFGALAVFLSGTLGALITWFLQRPKIKPEVDLLQAQADKTRAEMRSLDGQTLDRAYDRIDELHEICERLRTDLARLRGVEEENNILTGWNKRMKALLTLKGIAVPDKWVSGEHRPLDLPKPPKKA